MDLAQNVWPNTFHAKRQVDEVSGGSETSTVSAISQCFVPRCQAMFGRYEAMLPGRGLRIIFCTSMQVQTQQIVRFVSLQEVSPKLSTSRVAVFKGTIFGNHFPNVASCFFFLTKKNTNLWGYLCKPFS